jgi:hypothetical protein
VRERVRLLKQRADGAPASAPAPPPPPPGGTAASPAPAPPAGGAAGGALPPEYDHLYCRESGQAPEPLASLLFPLRGAPLQRDSRARARLGSTTWSRTCATSAR